MHVGAKLIGAFGDLFGKGVYSQNVVQKVSTAALTKYSNFGYGGPIGTLDDGNTTNYIQGYTYAAVDFVTPVVVPYVRLFWLNAGAASAANGYKIRGSNDSTNGVNGTWTDLATLSSQAAGWNTIQVAAASSYRFLQVTGDGTTNTVLCEWEWYIVVQPQASYNWTSTTKFPLTSGMLTAVGLASVNLPLMLDGTFGNHGGYIPNGTTAGNGGLKIDLGSPKELVKWREHCDVASATGQFRVYYSDDGITYTSAGSNVSDLGSGVWTEFTWTSVGAHRYWALLNTTTSNNQGWWSEVEVYEGGTVQNAIVITGAATVAPDPLTFACIVKGNTLVLDGASASLTPASKSKGVYLHLTGDLILVNGATANIDGLGYGGTVTGNQGEVDILPDSMKLGLALGKLAGYRVSQPGANGGTAGPPSGASYNLGTVGGTGSPGSGLQTGGGGGGGSGKYDVNLGAGAGGKGTAFGGGGGGGGAPRHSTGGFAGLSANDALAGGRGGGNTAGNGGGGGGGAGDPVGTSYPGDTTPGNSGTGGPGGILMAFVKGWIKVYSGCRISADGKAGGAAHTSYGGGGGGSGGGLVGLFYKGGYLNLGTVRAAGGLGGAGGSEAGNYAGGPGGAGSVITQQVV